MKVLTSWLREFANPDVSDSELAEKLTMAGLEVDGISTIAPAFNNVVVGYVLECEKHPNADKLNVCSVDVGSETLQIICGAKNVAKGLKVPVAIAGAVLPGNFKIKKAKLRGVESNGMICSESEIGLADSSEGIMELDENVTVGENIRTILNLDDTIIELDITPNRGDCFSILGVAREVCANYKSELTTQSSSISEDVAVPSMNISVVDTVHCPKYLTRVISGVDNSKQTPKWMADILTRSGQSLHSPIVDITNFVLLELGQPLHAFDKDSLQEEIIVRLARDGEKITLLNEQITTLQSDTLIIADKNAPVAIAGIMGGLGSATQPSSSNIVLEAAFFDNIAIAGKARNYGLHTESSLRFERGVDYELPEIAIDRATQLILDICGGSAGVLHSEVSQENLPQRQEITISYSKINKILGFAMDTSWVLEKFTDLGFEIIRSSTEEVTIVSPSFRFDINIEVDLIEELARLYGYDKLPTSTLQADAVLQTSNTLDKYNLKNTLIARNYNEVITYSFISEKMADIIGGEKISLLNPISSDMQFMRTSIVAGLLKTASDNINRKQSDLRIFESGLCFNGVSSDKQVEKIAGLITGRASNTWIEENRELDFFDIKADVLSIIEAENVEFVANKHSLLQQGQSADIFINGKYCGIIGALSPVIQQQLSLNKCFVFELHLEKLLIKNKLKYQQFSIYQSSSRDISVLVDTAIPYQKIINSINSLQQKNLVSVDLIDIWSDENMDVNKHSLTFSFSYQAQDKTLTDEEIEGSVNKILKLLIKEYSAEQR